MKLLREFIRCLIVENSSSEIQVDMLPPANLRGTDEWFMTEIDNETSIKEFFPRLWDLKYDKSFKHDVAAAIQRGKEQIKGEHGPLRTSNYDVVLTLKRGDTEHTYLRGDERYSSEEMAEYLKTTKFDLIPITVSVTSAGTHLLDGHHRWRAYILANMKPLILEISIERSTSETPKIIARSNPGHK